MVVSHDIQPADRSFLKNNQLDRPTSPLAKWPWTRTRLSVHIPTERRSVSASVPTPIGQGYHWIYIYMAVSILFCCPGRGVRSTTERFVVGGILSK